MQTTSWAPPRACNDCALAPRRADAPLGARRRQSALYYERADERSAAGACSARSEF